MARYQISKINIISADRNRRSLDGKYAGQFLVAVNPIDADGNFNYEPIKARGYVFGGKNMSVIGKLWVKPFDSTDDAESESKILVDGI